MAGDVAQRMPELIVSENPPVSPRRSLDRWDRLAWAGLAVAYLSAAYGTVFPFDPSAKASAYVWAFWWAFMCRTFMLHVGLLFVAILFGAALRRRWRFVVAALPLLAWSFGPELPAYAVQRPAPRGPTLRVMTLNVFGGNKNAAAVLTEVRRQRPDVLCLQEYTDSMHQQLAPMLTKDLPHSVPPPVFESGRRGVAVYSRVPLVEAGELPGFAPRCGPQVRVVMEMGGRPVVLYCIHMVSGTGGRHTDEKLVQFARLLELAASEKVPPVLCGDFNFTHRSAFVDALRTRGWLDVNEICGAGRSVTWAQRGWQSLFPGLRIDHIYLPRAFSCGRATVGGYVGSDHGAVIAEVGFTP